MHNGKIFIGSDNNNLYALSASDGSVIWSYTTSGQVWTAPAVSGDGKVCFGSLGHTVYCVDEETGVECGDNYLKLTSETLTDIRIAGTDSIEAIGRKKEHKHKDKYNY